jgi:hypothetical protein
LDEFVYSEDRGASLTAAGVRWLEEHAGPGRPFFAYLHFFDVHWPYDPPPVYRRQIDLAPTLLEAAGVDTPPRFRGHSLAEPAVRAFAEAGAWNAVHADGRKLVVNDETGVVELFDAGDRIDAHPLPLGENRDVLREHLLWYRRLERSAVVPGPGEGPAAEWGPEELRRLRALGYAE